MAKDPSRPAFHRVSALVLWVVYLVLAGAVIYTACIAIVNWSQIGV